MIGPLLIAATLCAAPPDTAFAFSDGSGTRVLALGEVTDPARLTRAVCDGRLLEVSFLAQQPRGDNDSRRQTSLNFDQTPGALYQVKGASKDASCLLGTSAFFATRPPVAVVPGRKPCNGNASAAAARLGKRAVERCLEVGTFRGGTLALVTYARRGSELLVGYVLLTETLTAMRRFPAKFEKGAPSCWRADDGCTFDPGSYRTPSDPIRARAG